MSTRTARTRHEQSLTRVCLATHPSTISNDEHLSLRRGYTLEATPVPIPNTAVKLQRADDTSSDRGGKVGRRDVKPNGPLQRAARFAYAVFWASKFKLYDSHETSQGILFVIPSCVQSDTISQG